MAPLMADPCAYLKTPPLGGTLPRHRAERALLTARSGRWATRRAGRGEAIADTAAVLGCDWHTVNASVRRWGQALLDADGDRIAAVVALGLDETLFCRRGRFAQRAWSTSIVDVARGQLLDMVPGRTAEAPARWLLRRPASWLAAVRWAVLDLSGPYRAAYDAAVPDAAQVADPFHVVRLANTALDEVRRRVQNQTLGHRGHAHDPLYRARKLLVSASENITENGRTRLRGLLNAGDPYGEVRDAWHAKETLRSIYDIPDAEVGAATVNQLAQDLQDPATGRSSTHSLPPEIRRAPIPATDLPSQLPSTTIPKAARWPCRPAIYSCACPASEAATSPETCTSKAERRRRIRPRRHASSTRCQDPPVSAKQSLGLRLTR